MANKEILISEATLKKITEYYELLKRQGLNTTGENFRHQIELNDTPLSEMSLEDFTQLLIQSKVPKIFAESQVCHDGTDWNLQEESILGDMSVHMPVTFYNDGGHYSSYKNHDTPISGNLVYVPGALLRSDILNTTTSDLEETIVNGQLDQQRFNDLYERRLLPQLFQINQQAGAEGKKAAITVPGIGTGQFAGKYQDGIKAAFRQALENVLKKHHAKLSNIDIVHYDPYEGDVKKTQPIGHIRYRVRPSTDKTIVKTGQLAFPEGANAQSHTLTSLVAWDHFSWPGNDFWAGDRATDDGVKAASTNTMAVITGIDGDYDPTTGSYLPPHFNKWEYLAYAENLSFMAPVFVVFPNGEKTALSAVSQVANHDEVQAPTIVTELPTIEEADTLVVEYPTDMQLPGSKPLATDPQFNFSVENFDLIIKKPTFCVHANDQNTLQALYRNLQIADPSLVQHNQIIINADTKTMRILPSKGPGTTGTYVSNGGGLAINFGTQAVREVFLAHFPELKAHGLTQAPEIITGMNAFYFYNEKNISEHRLSDEYRTYHLWAYHVPNEKYPLGFNQLSEDEVNRICAKHVLQVETNISCIAPGVYVSKNLKEPVPLPTVEEEESEEIIFDGNQDSPLLTDVTSSSTNEKANDDIHVDNVKEQQTFNPLPASAAFDNIVDDKFEESNILLNMYMRHQSACNAILTGLAVAVVALVAVCSLGLALPPAIGIVAGSALLASSLMFFASSTMTKPEAAVDENCHVPTAN